MKNDDVANTTLEHLWNIQVAQQRRILSADSVDCDQLATELVMAAIGELQEWLHASTLRFWRADQLRPKSAMLFELVDALKLLFAAAWYAGFSVEQLADAFIRKTRVVDQRIVERTALDGKICCAIDLDGVLADASGIVWDYFDPTLSSQLANLKPIPGAVEGVRELAQHYAIVIVTSRRSYLDDSIEVVTREWLKNANICCDALVMAQDKGLALERLSKRHDCVFRYAIDDSLKHAIDMAGVAQHSIWFKGQYQAGLICASDWFELIRKVEQIEQE